MPIFLKKSIAPQGELGVWEITEPIEYFMERMELFPEEELLIKDLQGKRKMEWAATRYLLHLMSGRNTRAACLKDEYGKPYLKGSTYFISLSHSHEMSAIIACPKLVGLDIQFIVPKIERIAKKFLSKDELDALHYHNRIETLHVYWGAKECLYKAYGKKLISYSKHLHVSPFEFKEDLVVTEGTIQKDDYINHFNIYAEKIENYILVYAVEK